MCYLILNKKWKLRRRGNDVILYNLKKRKKLLLNETAYKLFCMILNRSTRDPQTISLFSQYRKFFQRLFDYDIIKKASAQDTQEINIFPETYPFWIEWLVTTKCAHNYNCLHCCYSFLKNLNKQEPSGQQIEFLSKRLSSSGVFSVILTGGEPTLCEDIARIVQVLTEADIFVQIDTSGILLKELIKKLKNTELITVQISLDGATAHSHYKLRQRNSFHDAVSALSLTKLSGIKVKVSTVLTSLNIHELPKIYEILVKHQVQRWIITPLRPYGNAIKYYKMLKIPIAQQISAIQNVITLNKSNRRPVEICNPYPSLNPNGKFSITAFDALTKGCREGIHLLPDGTVCSCIYLPMQTKAGNLYNEEYSVIVDRINFNICNKKVSALSICGQCWFSSVCQGGCRAVALALTGDLLGCDLQTKEYLQWLSNRDE